MQNRGLMVCQRRFVFAFDNTEVTPPSIDADDSLPCSVRGQRHALVLALSTSRPTVPLVFLVGGYSEILAAVVHTIGVPVVNHLSFRDWKHYPMKELRPLA